MNLVSVIIIFVVSLNLRAALAFHHKASISVNPELISEVLNKQSQSLVEKQRYFDEYDFVIVGSGPGGCVLANRLTENPNWNVLLIEAGKVETGIQAIPVLAAYMQSTAYNWGYLSEPSPGSCLGMEGQRCGFPRGKALGGSSVINYMIYNRGNANDFDRWAAAGNPGWSWADVHPFFLKSEQAALKNLHNSPHHSSKGWLHVEDNQFITPLADGFVQASKYMGLREVDYNSGEQLGVSYLQSNTLRGKRHSAFQAFIKPILHRPNLHIMVNTRATKVLINPKTKVAQGVEYLRRRKRLQVKARKEVILSAGTFLSPQLLMLSGVGDRKDLTRLGIPVIKNLPVGKVMYDHWSHLGPTFVTNTTGQSLNAERSVQPENIAQYLHGRGPLTIPGGVEALSFHKTRVNNNRGPTVPDVEIIFVSGGYQSDEGTGISRGMNVKPSIYNPIYKSLESPKIDAFSLMPMIFHPKSVGYLELKSSNPFHWPRLYPRFFSHPDDVETMLEGIKYALQLAKTPPFKKLGARLHDIPVPSCAHLHFGSDNYWRCSIRTLSSTLHHQISTCRMGPANDPTAVVSHELKVYGIDRLRIVDTSIVPHTITAHTNAVSFMIGEKAADLIKRQWRSY